MSLSQITLEDLMILKTDILICQFLKGIWQVWLSVVYVLILKKSSKVMIILILVNFKLELWSKSANLKMPKKLVKPISPTHMLIVNPIIQTVGKGSLCC